jgi:hypothetical protein
MRPSPIPLFHAVLANELNSAEAAESWYVARSEKSLQYADS